MPLTTLDPKTALVVIDMQKGIVGLPVVHSADEISAKIGELADAFRAKKLPVVLVNVDGSGPPGRTDRQRGHYDFPDDWAELIPELNQQPSDHLVTKQQWGAFHKTSIDGFLRENGITQVVIAGIATSIGVESTARAAHEHGYHVTLVIDAMTDMDETNHRHSIERIFPALGETGTTTEILALLDAN